MYIKFISIYIKQHKKDKCQKNGHRSKTCFWANAHIYLRTDLKNLIPSAVKTWISMSLTCFTVEAQTLFLSFAKSMHCHYMWFVNAFIELECFNFDFDYDSIIYYQRKGSHKFFRKALHQHDHQSVSIELLVYYRWTQKRTKKHVS